LKASARVHEPVLDTSCYFVFKIGFDDSNEAFDFDVVLSDHEKYICHEHEKESDFVVVKNLRSTCFLPSTKGSRYTREGRSTQAK